MDLCVLVNLIFCEAQPQQPSEQLGSLALDVSVHRTKLLVLVRPTTVEFGTWENFIEVVRK